MPEEKPKYKRPRTDALKASQKKYDTEKTIHYGLKLNLVTDGDIITRLEDLKQRGDSVQGFIKSCIRYEMAHECIDPAPRDAE